MPITYNGTNTDNLFVAGWKNGKEVKLKVKNLSCHGGITVEAIAYSENEYTTGAQLIENIDNTNIKHYMLGIQSIDTQKSIWDNLAMSWESIKSSAKYTLKNAFKIKF